MRTLIVEDDFVGRRLLLTVMEEFGKCDIAVNGLEAIQACRMALDEGTPYDLILMDIMMPHLSGLDALERIRVMEKERGVRTQDSMKVVMVTSVDDPKNVSRAFFHGEALSYIIKPVDKKILIEEIRKLKLIA